MKKIQNLEELKKLNKSDLINEMLKGEIKGGTCCAVETYVDEDSIEDSGPMSVPTIN